MPIKRIKGPKNPGRTYSPCPRPSPSEPPGAPGTNSRTKALSVQKTNQAKRSGEQRKTTGPNQPDSSGATETKQRAVAAVSRFPPRRMRNLRLEAPKCHRVNTTLSQSGSMPIEQVRFFSRCLFFLDPRLENAHQTICHATKKLLLLSE